MDRKPRPVLVYLQDDMFQDGRVYLLLLDSAEAVDTDALCPQGGLPYPITFHETRSS